MELSISDHELIRERWRRARQLLAGSFFSDDALKRSSREGIDRRVKEPRARLLILPRDPGYSFIQFDDDFWQWWSRSRPSASEMQSVSWGDHHEPTSMAAITFSTDRTEARSSLFALHRNGGLDVILGGEIVCEENDHNAFKLTHIFNRIRSALSFYTEVVDRYGLEGPFEISSALRNTHGTILSDLASRWSESGSGSAKRRECKDQGIYLRREVFEWPKDEVQSRDLAIEIASWIEDSWGYRARRFLPREDRG